MRAVLIATVLASSSLARADTVMTIGASFAGRSTGPSFGSTADSTVTDVLGGARIAMSFEAAPLPTPPPASFVSDLRLAPELLAGFLADSTHAEGYVGAGARLDLRIVGHRNDTVTRGGIYAAARAIMIGGRQDGAVELVIGSYITNARGARVGWEGGAIMRPRHDAPADQSKELDAVVTIYVGR